MSLASVHIGVAGWDFRHWVGKVYPRNSRIHPLEFLADRFDCVEIPDTFNAAIRPELAHLWLTRVRHNPRFRFTARAPREFTHERRIESGFLQRFQEGLRPLLDQDRLGCLLMQFPFSFRFTEENKQFLIHLRRVLHPFPLVAELRHDSWTTSEGMGTLIDYHVGFVNLDQPGVMRATMPGSALTTGTGYVKLHGRECGPGHFDFAASAAKTSGNSYLYSIEELESWKGRIRRLSQFADQVFVVFNNDGGGRSAVNALQMESLLDHQAVAVNRYPQGAAQTARQALAAMQSELFAPAA